MARVAVTRTDSVLDRIQHVRQRVERRAYELFRQRDGMPGDATSDWLNAERETNFRVPVDPAKAKAEYKNGVLTGTVPAADTALAKPVAVKAA